MRDKRALQKIREEFQRFSLKRAHRDDLLAHALRFLCESMEVDRAAVFLFDEPRHALVARQLVDRSDVLPGEEEIAILPDSPLDRLLTGKRPYLIINDPTYFAYMALRAFGNIFGVLRVENVHRKRPFTEEDI